MQVGKPNPKTVRLFETDRILLAPVSIFEFGKDGKLLSFFPNILFDNVIAFEIGTKNDGELWNVRFDKVTTFEIGIRNGGKFICAQLLFIILFDKLLLSLKLRIFNSGKLFLLNNYLKFVSFFGIGTLSLDFKHFPKGTLCVSRLFFKKKQFESGTIDDCQLFDERIISNLTPFEIGRVCIWEFYLRVFLVIIWLFAICDKMSVEADKFCDKIRVTKFKYLCNSESTINLCGSEFAKAASVTKLAGEKIIFFNAYNFQFLIILVKNNVTVPLRAVFLYFDKSIVTLLLVPSELLQYENSQFYHNSKKIQRKMLR